MLAGPRRCAGTVVVAGEVITESVVVTIVNFFNTFVDVIAGETVVSHAETIVASSVVTSSNVGTFCIGVTSSEKAPIVNSRIVDWITDQLWRP